MNTPKWTFFVLTFWIFATIWCSMLEPDTSELMPIDVQGTVKEMANPDLTTALSVDMIWSMVKNIWKALTFDYSIFEGWLVIVRIVCIAFSVASLYLIADIIYKIRSMIFGA